MIIWLDIDEITNEQHGIGAALRNEGQFRKNKNRIALVFKCRNFNSCLSLLREVFESCLETSNSIANKCSEHNREYFEG
jgi:ABC-type histidine transport system ATPase subunit